MTANPITRSREVRPDSSRQNNATGLGWLRCFSTLTENGDHLPDFTSCDGRAKWQSDKCRRELDAEPTERPTCLPTLSEARHHTQGIEFEHTGTSMIATIRLVRDPPMAQSHSHRAANSNSMQATEAGKDTSKCLKRESTPKHAARIARIPVGTRSHDCRMLSRDLPNACNLFITCAPSFELGHKRYFRRSGRRRAR